VIDERSDKAGARGQGVVEFALVLPLFMILLLTVLEFGIAFSHSLTLEYATREGARSGSALANGGGPLGCSVGQSPNAATVDPMIIEAVERVLRSAGSPISVSDVIQIRIFKASSSGGEAGPVNIWTSTPGAGPVPADSTTSLDFSPSLVGWSVCSRSNVANPSPDSLGISISYTYRFRTGLGSLIKLVSASSIGPTFTVTDKTVMTLNPTAQ
jgi:hypothetical protein